MKMMMMINNKMIQEVHLYKTSIKRRKFHKFKSKVIRVNYLNHVHLVLISYQETLKYFKSYTKMPSSNGETKSTFEKIS